MTPLEEKPTRKHIAGKIIQVDYEWVTSQEGSRWVCLTNAQIQAILATTDYLRWRTRWKAFELLPQSFLHGFAADLERRLLMNDCCCDQNAQYEPPQAFVRLNDDGYMEVSNDNGDTWQVDTVRDYRFNSPTLPQIVPSDTEADEKCFHVLNILAQVEKAQQAYNAQWEVGESLTELIAVLITFLGTLGLFGGFLLGLPYLIISAIVYCVLGAGQAAWNAAFTGDFYSELKCALLESAPDTGIYSPTSWSDTLNSIDAMTFSIARVWTWNLVRAMGASGLTNAAQIDAFSEDDCSDCESGWCYLMDFTTDRWEDVVDIVAEETSSTSGWEEGVGFRNVGSGTQIAVLVSLPVGSYLTDFAVVIPGTGSASVGTVRRSGTNLTGSTGSAGGWTIQNYEAEAPDDPSAVGVTVVNNPTRTLEKMWIKGTGTDPFGLETGDCDPPYE